MRPCWQSRQSTFTEETTLGKLKYLIAKAKKCWENPSNERPRYGGAVEDKLLGLWATHQKVVSSNPSTSSQLPLLGSWEELYSAQLYPVLIVSHTSLQNKYKYVSEGVTKKLDSWDNKC